MAISCSALRATLHRLSAGTRSSSWSTRPWICRQCVSTVRSQWPRRRRFHSESTNEANGASEQPTALDAAEGTRRGHHPLDTFPRRHIGPTREEGDEMLKALDPPVENLDDFVQQVIPADILSSRQLFAKPRNPLESQTSSQSWEPVIMTESTTTKLLRQFAKKNMVMKNYIGCGYYGTHVPEVIKRNVLESPAWYTSYTPYQPEISQGRLESLLNFQTMVSDLTALPISNASLLDESTAAAEAMTLSMNAIPASRLKSANKTFLVSHMVHPQTLAVLRSRADGFDVKIEVADVLADNGKRLKELGSDLIGVLVQYPDTEGGVEDFRGLADLVHAQGTLLSVATDLLALTILTPPGEFGADIAFGSAQRFGVPLGYGGPHAAFFAVAEKYKRKIPGRLIGVSKDRLGDKAMRLALQTREQHIRREKATSNVCTAQALLANMSAFYAIYHGPQGLKLIAEKIVTGVRVLERGLRELGYDVRASGRSPDGNSMFDTIVVTVGDNSVDEFLAYAVRHFDTNMRKLDSNRVAISLDETTEVYHIKHLLSIFRAHRTYPFLGVLAVMKEMHSILADILPGIISGEINGQVSEPFQRQSAFLTHPVFNSYHSETEMMRYIHHLRSKDLSLVHSMIPLGSCTMKLNSAVEMAPISWPEFANIHPFAPFHQVNGYRKLIKQLEDQLAHITGFDAVSLQPNSGAQGEFAGLRLIRKYQEEQPGKKRDICLIPVSAHGTNPASAAMAGMRVVTVKCDTKTGNLDMDDLKAKCEKHSEELGAIMITYPSTFGVFEPAIKAVCDMVHQHGGQVYMDGANMNAQIGLCSPGEIGADVCHLNLHKTFCIPHGGGGPGVGPICVKNHLRAFLPGHPLVSGLGGIKHISPVSGAPWGSASILHISWSYIKMMGGPGLTTATKITLLNANYLMSRLRPHYPILYTNSSGRCAHEFILDVRKFKETAGIEAIDIAKRLQDYGFHAPTMSWPVANTLMIEPTESEGKAELDRFVEALVGIRTEIREVEEGRKPREGNVLKMAPHSLKDLLTNVWERPYSREEAAWPVSWLKEKKFWPSVTRVDDGSFPSHLLFHPSFPLLSVLSKLLLHPFTDSLTTAYGDTNLFCTCGPIDPVDDNSDSDGITGAAAPTPT